MERLRLLQVVLWIYVAGSLIGCLMLVSGKVGNVNDVHIAATTTGKILGLGSLLALAYGAARAALDPVRNKVVVQVLILFTSLAALALLYRLFVEGHRHSVTTWFLLIPAIAGPVLMAALYPYGADESRRAESSDPGASGPGPRPAEGAWTGGPMRQADLPAAQSPGSRAAADAAGSPGPDGTVGPPAAGGQRQIVGGRSAAP